MTVILDLPSELLLRILESLADIDLLSLFVSRMTCRAFQTIATAIVENSMANHGQTIRGFLQSHFLTLLDSSQAPEEWAPTMNFGWAPFHTLPWTADATLRDKYLRMDASWRQIPLVSQHGHIVKRMQCIRLERRRDDWIQTIQGGHVGFRMMVLEGEQQFYFPQGFPLGLYWDLLLSSWESILQGGWTLLDECRVQDPLEFDKLQRELIFSNAETFYDSEHVKRLLGPDPDYAVLFCYGKLPQSFDLERRWKQTWMPEPLGEDDFLTALFPHPEDESW